MPQMIQDATQIIGQKRPGFRWQKSPLEAADGQFGHPAGRRHARKRALLLAAIGGAWVGLMCSEGRPRGTVGKASASEARGPGFEPPWLVQRSRWESRPLSLVGNGAGAVTNLIDWKRSVFPRGNGRFLVTKGVHIASFRCLSDETLIFVSKRDRYF